jgi:hypothetical protein
MMSNSASLKPRFWHIADLPGLSAENQQQLRSIGIENTLQLLQRGVTAAKRQQLANQLSIHSQYVNRWVALANLAQVPSVGCQYCGLLLHAGISSVPALAQTSPQQLHRQVRKFHVANMQRSDLCPPVEQVNTWIQQARSLRP